MRLILSVMLLLFMLSGCKQKSETSTQNQPTAENLPEVKKEGAEITGQAFTTLSSNLQQALSEGGVSSALEFCNIQAMPLADSLSKNYGVEIRRASHQPRNPDNRADSLEAVSIKKYINALEANGELKPYTYRTRNSFIYHAPIRITGQLCLNGHGSPGIDISEKDMEVIRELYPEDEATGFSQGDLRGIWAIEFPKNYFETDKKQ